VPPYRCVLVATACLPREHRDYAREIDLPVEPRPGLMLAGSGVSADSRLVARVGAAVLHLPGGTWEVPVYLDWGTPTGDPPPDYAARLGPGWRLAEARAVAPRRQPIDDGDPPF
jgi:hypothetical protein